MTSAVRDTVLPDGHRAMHVTGYAAAREALFHPDLSKDMLAAMAADGEVVAEGLPGRAFARHMLSVDPPDHTRLRALAAKAFTRTRLAVIEPAIRRRTDELLTTLAGSTGPVDLMAGFARPLPFSVVGDLLGIEGSDQGPLADSFAMLLSPYAGDPPPEVVAASDRVVAYLEGLVDRRSLDHEGLVGDLARAMEEGSLDRQELLSTVFQLVVAGHDTTTNLIGNGMVALLRNPDQRAMLTVDPGLVPQAIEEFLRFDPPAPHATFRYAVHDVTIAGTVIPAGAQVLVSLVSAGLDEERNPDPDVLDIHRTGAAHLAFGHGVHHCLGARLARMEAEIAFTALLDRFPRMALAVPADQLRWDHGDGLVLRGLSELPVHLAGAPVPSETAP